MIKLQNFEELKKIGTNHGFLDCKTRRDVLNALYPIPCQNTENYFEWKSKLFHIDFYQFSENNQHLIEYDLNQEFMKIDIFSKLPEK